MPAGAVFLLCLCLFGILTECVTIHERLPALSTPSLTITGIVDSTAPTLSAFTCPQPSANPRFGTDIVTCTATATDDISQVDRVTVSFQNPSKFRQQSATCYSQTATPTQFDCTISFPIYSEVGTWLLSDLSVIDRAHNVRTYTNAQAAGLGCTVSIYVNGTGDIQAPQLLQFKLDPRNLTVANNVHDEFYFDANVTDNLSGVTTIKVKISPPVTSTYIAQLSSNAPYTGTRLAGRFESSVSTTVFAPLLTAIPSGYWTVNSVEVEDAVGNKLTLSTADLQARGFDSTVYVLQQGSGTKPPPSDVNPPFLLNFAMQPTSVDLSSSSKLVFFNFTVRDKEAYLECECQLKGPSDSWLNVRITPSDSDVIILTVTGNTFMAKQQVFSNYDQPPGVYAVSALILTDRTGNKHAYGNCSPDTQTVCGPLNSASVLFPSAFLMTVAAVLAFTY
jgi:hypothetical protein